MEGGRERGGVCSGWGGRRLNGGAWEPLLHLGDGTPHDRTTVSPSNLGFSAPFAFASRNAHQPVNDPS